MAVQEQQQQEMWTVRLNIRNQTHFIYDLCSTEEIADKRLEERKSEDKGKWWVNRWEKVGPHPVLTASSSS